MRIRSRETNLFHYIDDVHENMDGLIRDYRGIPEMSKDHDGIIFYKNICVGITIETGHELALDEELHAIRIRSRCQYLEATGVQISKYTIEGGWEQYAPGFLRAQKARLQQSTGGLGLIFSRIYVEVYPGDTGDFFVPGSPLLNDIRKMALFRETCGDQGEQLVEKTAMIYGKEPARPATAEEIVILISCYEHFTELISEISHEAYPIMSWEDPDSENSTMPQDSFTVMEGPM